MNLQKRVRKDRAGSALVLRSRVRQRRIRRHRNAITDELYASANFSSGAEVTAGDEAARSGAETEAL